MLWNYKADLILHLTGLFDTSKVRLEVLVETWVGHFVVLNERDAVAEAKTVLQE